MAPSSKKKRGAAKCTETALPESVSLDEEKQKSFETKLKRIKQNNPEVMTPGVVYVGNIPHGFFEPQMKQFFSQFGTVTQLRLSRSIKTGNSRGYAFIEFKCDEVAKIVAETMNNYLMFERLLKCKYVPEESQHVDLFKGADRKFTKPKAHKIAIERHNYKNKQQKQQKTAKRFLRKHGKMVAKLAEMGVELKVSNINQAVEEAKKNRRAVPKGDKSIKIGEDNSDQLSSKSEKTSKRKTSGDTSKVTTRQSKKIKTVEVKSEPAKIKKRTLAEKKSKTAKILKKPTVSSTRKKRLSI